MAKSNNNVLTHGLSGKIGDLLVFSQRNGQTVVAAVPRKTTKELSETQQQHRRKFQLAVLYAKVAREQPEYQEAASRKGKLAYNVAVADFFNAPDIHSVDLSAYTGQAGDPIHVHVVDDFSVKAVSLRIINADGSLVEEGQAYPDPSGYRWTYIATQNNSSLEGDKIEVHASDTPGNLTRHEHILP